MASPHTTDMQTLAMEVTRARRAGGLHCCYAGAADAYAGDGTVCDGASSGRGSRAGRPDASYSHRFMDRSIVVIFFIFFVSSFVS